MHNINLVLSDRYSDAKLARSSDSYLFQRWKLNDAGCKQSDEEFVFILESILKKMAWIGVT